ERYVAEHVARLSADPSLATDAKAALDERLRARRAALETIRSAVRPKLAGASATVARLVVELTRSKGRVREAIDERLQAETESVAALERQLADADRELAAMGEAEATAEWVTQALNDFRSLWDVLTAPNRGRLLRAMIDKIVVDGKSGRIDMHLVDLGVGL